MTTVITNEQVVTVVTTGEGPRGEAAGADLHYVHHQEAPSNKWTIKHNLGKFPSVSVQDSANSEVEGDVEQISANELVINFSAAFSGTAYLN